MKATKPLWQRLYYEGCFTEVARLVGYAGFPTAELEGRTGPLVERFGKAAVEDALRCLTTHSPYREQPVVRLREDVRKLCWQILGPPPEHPLHDYVKGVPEAQKVEEPPAKKRRPRKKAQ